MRQLLFIQTEELDFKCGECGGDLKIEQDENTISVYPCEKCAAKPDVEEGGG